MDAEPAAYQPTISEARAERLRRWHEAAYQEMRRRGPVRVAYLGLDLVVPDTVFAPTPVSDLLGKAVLAEVDERDRVLDMGTGSGGNAILAASRSPDVEGVDVNPEAVTAAAANAECNGVGARTTFYRSDVFDAVEGRFDLIVFDPPFRWFPARDLLEMGMADGGYQALTRFVTQAGRYLTERGRILLFFGSSGDIGYLYRLVEDNGFARETLATRELTKEGLTVSYVTLRLAKPGSAR